jgi:hypothetical protein
MSNWSAALIKKSLSETTAEECRRHLGSAYAEEVAALTAAVESKDDLKRLKASWKRLKKLLPEDTAEVVAEEVAEICDDARFAASAHGKYLLALNAWQETFFREFRGRAEFADVVVGGHPEQRVVFVAGIVDREEIYRALVEYLAGKNPPFRLLTDVRLGSRQGPRLGDG